MEITLRTPSIRFVLVHYHIFKNAGTTVEWILRREFPDAFATLHSSDPSAVLGADDLRDCLLNHPKLAALSSHHLRYPMGELAGTVFFDCCFLRHPLARLQSLYDHFRRTGDEDWLSQLARRETSKEFLKTLVETAPHMISNVQTFYLATGGAFTRPAGSWDLARAIEILHGMAFPGLVEQFDESLVSAEYFLRPAFPALRLEYVAQNVSPAKDHPRLDADRSRLITLWGDELHSQLVRLNEYDLKLHKRAADEITRRRSMVPGFPRLLEEFRRRCQLLRSQLQAEPELGSHPGPAPA